MKILLLIYFQILYISITPVVYSQDPVSNLEFKGAGPGNLATRNSQLATKIQAAFWGISSVEQGEEQLRLLKTYGFNTALVNDSGYQVKEDLWRGWGQIADKYAIHLFPIHSFAGTDEIKVLKGKFRPYVDRQGKVLHSTPCPLDEEYWNVSIGQRFAQLARI